MIIEAIENQATSHAIKALEQKRFFKLVCGASLTDITMVENLSYIFTIAGAHVIDLAPKADVIFAARKGIERACQFADTPIRRHVPLLMASIQLDKDPHFRKAEVDYNLCDLCGACVKVCPTEAFGIERTGDGANRRWGEHDQFKYKIERCFGCGICPDVCHVDALTMMDTKPTPKETLIEMISLGIKSVEFHFGKNYGIIEEIWDEIKDLVKELTLLSFSIGSGLLSDKEIKNAANLCFKLAGRDIILQCDGTPMSGALEKKSMNGNNSDNKSFQVAGIIEKENLPVYLQISGGTNQYSFNRSIDAGLHINGIAIGSYARKQLMPYMEKLTSDEEIIKAVDIASSLVMFNCK